ncbi:monovalent cation/H+ antiporter complex subunit F [Candidatus Venteria ishoeyi]|uniref:Putative monovalent cation/H+ antiporter subunit F n=1 Tax=Candidatus Venteria ishoeyi TaxID=1899563 RepID=A0A1H6F449_9GAMM|nr:cation:proton antiporter [Candidatus Venteria ishoeyi]MDM8547079.1 cation:proton antiporter [Candidatus Venteria ishoeyi]SEH04161.1 putative monovalent cation/H+ antiporter subunit F [Candidatus Venteria ishoeyi]SEH07708.1 putative monovalent cation/H+ antiporter subunit F [Candidatus Venteria ishoeyi]
MDNIEIIAMTLTGLALVLGTWRMLQGPTTPDRVVAADTLTVIITVVLVWVADKLERSLYLDIALVYAALAFVGVVTIARMIETPLHKSETEKNSEVS